MSTVPVATHTSNLRKWLDTREISQAFIWYKRSPIHRPLRILTLSRADSKRIAEACALALNAALRLAGVYDSKGPAFFITVP